MKPLEKTSVDLFHLLRSRFSPITIGDENAEVTTDPAQARFFSFAYKEAEEPIGTVSISIISNRNLKVYYSNDMVENIKLDSNWYSFLKELRYFAKQNLLSFDARDIQKDQLDSRDYNFIKNYDRPYKENEVEIAESSMYGTKRKSIQQFENANMIVYHRKTVDETIRGARSRYIESIFIESNGERFRFPVNYLNGARAMAVHVSEGGTPYDAIGKHIVSTVNEMQNLAKFARLTRRHAMEDSEAASIRDRVVETYQTIKRDIMRMQNVNNYKQFAETFTPTDESSEADVTELQEKFTRKIWNEKMNELLPSVQRALNTKNVSEENNKTKSIADKIADLENMLKRISGNTSSMKMKKYAIQKKIQQLKNNINEAEEGTYMKQWYNYSEDYAMLELYVDGKLVDQWDGYFGANETGNPLQAKFIAMAKENGVDPIGLKVIDGDDGDEGVFTSSGLKWNSNEADIDENAFNQAAAAAARAGKDTFEFDGKTYKTKMNKDTAHKLNEVYIKTSKDAVDTLSALRKIGKSIERGQGTYDGNLANMYVNDVYDVMSWLENNANTNDSEFKQIIGPVIELRKKAKRIEREPNSGSDASFGNQIVNVLYPLMQWIETNVVNKNNEEVNLDEASPSVEKMIQNPNFKLVLKKDPAADQMIRTTKFNRADGLLAYIMSDIASRLIGNDVDAVANFASEMSINVGEEGETFGTKMTPEYKRDKQLAMLLAKKYLEDIKRIATDDDYAREVRKEPGEVYGAKKKRSGGYHEAVSAFEDWVNKVVEATTTGTVGTTGTVKSNTTNAQVVKALSGGDANKAREIKRISDKLARGQKLTPQEMPVAGEIAKSVMTTKKPTAAMQALAQDEYTDMDEAWGKEEENPTKDAIIRRLSISGRLSDLLKQHGLDRVEAAINDVAEFHSDAEELGSSDISIMVRQVLDNLSSTEESVVTEKTLRVKADQDYDGDGEIESPEDEYMGSKDRAIKKSLRHDESEDEDFIGESLALLKKFAGV